MSKQSQNSATKIEVNGINPIPEHERHGKPSGLFPIWFSWNISIFGITCGMYVFSLGLSVTQAIIAGILGYFLSCALVGIIAVPSVRMGLPSLTVSRCTFGFHGNKFPTIFGFLGNIGWKVTMLSMASTTLADLLANLISSLQNTSGNPSTFCLVLSFIIVIGFTMIGAVYGYSLIVKAERYIAWITGIMTFIYLFFFIPQIDFSMLGSAQSGSLGKFIGGIVLAMTMVGLGFLNYGGDYARYLPSKTNGGSVVFWTTLGIALPVSILLILGVFLSIGNAELLDKAAHEPLAALTGILPFWFYIPFSIVIVISLMSAGMTGIYSSGLALLAMGVPLSRAFTTILISVLIALGCFYLTFISESFLSTFTSFLATISVIMGAWGAIMVVDIARLKANNWSIQGAQKNSTPIRFSAIISILLATFVGLGTITSSDPYIGKITSYLLADSMSNSIITQANIGVLLSMATASICYFVLCYIVRYENK